MIELERAAPEDVPVFFAMEQDPDARSWITAYAEDEHAKNIHDGNLIYLRIVDNNALVGFFILLEDSDGTSVEFRRIVVTDRGRGIGQRAIAAMENFCRTELGRRRIWLDVFESNSRGIHIYEKLGYQRYGEYEQAGRRLFLYEKHLGENPSLS